MRRLSDAELYCVSTNMRSTSEVMQLEIAMSTSRYLPPRGTAGLERCCVRGKRRVPAPPPRITASSFELAGILMHQLKIYEGMQEQDRGAGILYQDFLWAARSTESIQRKTSRHREH